MLPSVNWALYFFKIMTLLQLQSNKDTPYRPNIFQLNKEKEVIGIFISGHPLDDFKPEIDAFCNGRKDYDDDLRLQIWNLATHDDDDVMLMIKKLSFKKWLHKEKRRCWERVKR